MTLTRRSSLVALLGAFVAGCGGGGSGGGTASAMAGSTRSAALSSRSDGTQYPLSIYLPPANGAVRANVPIVYLLDGESRFQTMVDIVEAMHAQVMIVAIGNEALRARDYVPPNTCTPGGGGEAVFLQFISGQVVPFIEGSYPSDPARRILLGHSHGGSFVYYALFDMPASPRFFSAFLSSDASIDCMRGTVDGWESAYAAASAALPVRLHISYSANNGNVSFSQQIQARRYAGLTMVTQIYGGGHVGMIPAAFADALAFALA